MDQHKSTFKRIFYWIKDWNYTKCGALLGYSFQIWTIWKLRGAHWFKISRDPLEGNVHNSFMAI